MNTNKIEIYNIDLFLKSLLEIKKFLSNKHEYFNMNIDLEKLLKINNEKEIKEVFNSYENNNKENFTTYNDLKPVFIENSYCIKDYGLNHFYLVKEENDNFKIFMLDINEVVLVPSDNDFVDWIYDFLIDNNQEFFFFKKLINEKHLIAEFKDNNILFLTKEFDSFLIKHNFILNKFKAK